MNKKQLLTTSTLALLAVSLSAQQRSNMKPEETEVWTPVPRVVSITPENNVPSDAISLFNGHSGSEWVSNRNAGQPIEWTIDAGVLTVAPGKGDIRTKKEFTDYQLHVEWRSPDIVKGEGQGRGNSGIFMQGRYEVQVLDSYENATYPNGQAASIYKQYIPLVNATKPPGEWQTYDIIWTAPRFNDEGILISKARVTVLHNGVLVQNNTEVDGSTEYIGLPKYTAHGPGPIILQDHGDLVSFRNIWIREL